MATVQVIVQVNVASHCAKASVVQSSCEIWLSEEKEFFLSYELYPQ